MRTADYGWYRDLPYGFSFDEIGGDPRLNSQHSISSVVDNREERILEILLGELADDIEVQSVEEKLDEQISPSPYRKRRTSSDDDVSNAQDQQTPFGKWLEAALIQRGMTQNDSRQTFGCFFSIHRENYPWRNTKSKKNYSDHDRRCFRKRLG